MSNAFSHLRASVWPLLLTSESIHSIGFFAHQSIEKSGFSYEQQTALQNHSAPKEANSKFWYFIRQRTCVWRPQDGHDQLVVCIRIDTLFLPACKCRQPAVSPRAYDVLLVITMMNCYPLITTDRKWLIMSRVKEKTVLMLALWSRKVVCPWFLSLSACDGKVDGRRG